MAKLVLLRHGQSLWNKENRFTGWVDIDLAEEGIVEAKRAAELLLKSGIDFQTVHTSFLKRAIKTAFYVLDGMDRLWLTVQKSWRLNERHYGALQGLNKAETAERHGEDQVKIWRRSYDTPPPQISADDPQHPSKDPKYRGVPADELPVGESLKLTVARVLPYWNEVLEPELRGGKNVLVVAHGNSLRALVQYLDRLSEDQVVELNIPTGQPLMYEFDSDMKILSSRYLASAEEIERAQAEVAAQGQAKR